MIGKKGLISTSVRMLINREIFKAVEFKVQKINKFDVCVKLDLQTNNRFIGRVRLLIHLTFIFTVLAQIVEDVTH